MKKIVVFGGGLVGGVMARDLSSDSNFKVTVVDRDEGVLASLKARMPIETRKADLSDLKAVGELAAAHDFVVGAAPGFMGFRVLKTVLEAGRNCVDISFMPEDATELDKLAKDKGLTAVVDCGVAPGMSNLLTAKIEADFDTMEQGLIMVGGLPVTRRFPWEYAAVFSPIDVIEEYTRIARYKEHGQVVEREALSDPEFVNLPGVGTMESFNTDGLRSLLRTIKCPNLKEKTLRWPGHIEKIRVLRETGFFSQEPIEVGGARIRPIDLTAKLMFPMWKLKENEEELTVMRVEGTGHKNGKKKRIVWDLLDKTNPKTRETSMARTTGFPATSMARYLMAGKLNKPGVHPPEVFGRDQAVINHLMTEQRERGVVYTETVEA
ncbi:MAG: saccharopine dehydrogenase C-terminal domain-containing protein [Myxococcales bacterium]